MDLLFGSENEALDVKFWVFGLEFWVKFLGHKTRVQIWLEGRRSKRWPPSATVLADDRTLVPITGKSSKKIFLDGLSGLLGCGNLQKAKRAAGCLVRPVRC